MHTRRTLTSTVLAGALALGGLGLASGAAAAPPDDAGNADCAGRGIPAAKIGVQQYTYGPVLFAEEPAIEDVIAHMSELGMRNVERFGGTFGLTLEEYDDLWDDYQVRPIASHSSLDLDTWDETLATAKELNQKYVGSGGFGGPGFGSLEDTLQTAENLNELGERALKQGLRLYVHNHDREFTTTYPYDIDDDGDLEETPVIEIVLAETDPRYVSLELDVHWARIGLAGGRGSDGLADELADPSNQQMLVDFIEQYEDRIVFLHVKDTTTEGGFADVGEGTTDWGDVFRAATSVEHYFIEYDFPPDPYASVEDSWEYLTCMTF